MCIYKTFRIEDHCLDIIACKGNNSNVSKNRLCFLLARIYLGFFSSSHRYKNILFFFSPVRHLIEIYRVARAYEMCRKFLHSHRQIFQCNELTKSPRAVPYFQCHKRLWGSFNNYVDKMRRTGGPKMFLMI